MCVCVCVCVCMLYCVVESHDLIKSLKLSLSVTTLIISSKCSGWSPPGSFIQVSRVCMSTSKRMDCNVIVIATMKIMN